MKKAIWKFQLQTITVQTVLMPKEATILTVQTQNEELCLWALVDREAETEDRIIEIFGTGHPLTPDLNRKYLGTYQLQNGAFVGHVFEREK